jgi:hypothetical protein
MLRLSRSQPAHVEPQAPAVFAAPGKTRAFLCRLLAYSTNTEIRL